MKNVLNLDKFGFDKNEFPFSQIYGPVSFDFSVKINRNGHDYQRTSVQMCTGLSSYKN